MPIFEYQCEKCGHVCDALQKLSDKPLRNCPECGKPALKKLLSTPAFHVKGKGGRPRRARASATISMAGQLIPTTGTRTATPAGTRTARASAVVTRNPRMPIYEYRCQGCGHELEALQKFDEGPLRKCPECGALKLKRLVSAPSFRLKGTGWYETDFKKDGKKKLADAGDGKAAEKEGQKEDKKTSDKDAKPSSETKESSAAGSTADAKGGKAAAARPESTTGPKSGSGKASAPPD